MTRVVGCMVESKQYICFELLKLAMGTGNGYITGPLTPDNPKTTFFLSPLNMSKSMAEEWDKILWWWWWW